ncbi:hypothetical protein HK104_000868 [Borealophlyctis nickersoniae]|nr:hypothetical protein HK104_000868 [Borealophlyctis nickersoniae]
MTSKKDNENKTVNCIQAYSKKDLYTMAPDVWEHRLEIAKDKMNSTGRVVKTYYWYKSLEEFVELLLAANDDTKWYYEIIPGNVATPMYFDIEWYHDCSTFSSPEAVINEIVGHFDAMMGVATAKAANQILQKSPRWYILRSDEDNLFRGKVKFSYHLIYRSGYLLRSAEQRKRLFDCFVSYLDSQDSLLFTLPDEHGGKKMPLDPSVYSNWQTLRTIYSTKLGSSRRFRPVDLHGGAIEVTAVSQIYPYFVRLLKGNEVEFDVQASNLPEYETRSGSGHLRRSTACMVGNSPRFDGGFTRLEEQLVTEPPEEVTSLENDRSVEFFLRCIPNRGAGQPWEIYFAIAAAVQRSTDGNFTTFLKWAEKSNKFEKADVDNLWKSLSNADRASGYNEGTLCRFAKRCAPWAFRVDDMDFHTRLPLRKYSSRYMEPLPLDVGVIVTQSPMGSGKTYGMANFILELDPRRVLLLSSRRTYA